MSSVAPRPLILASTSQRRAALLVEAGVCFEQVDPPFDDAHAALDAVPPTRAAEALAYLKAVTTADRHPGRLVLGCDTIVRSHGRALGKPTDRADAERMLRALFDARHEVISGVALVRAGDWPAARIFHDTAQVHIAAPNEAELHAYLRAGEWRGKAGGYNLAELHDRWRFDVQGDPATVTGLPVRRLRAELETLQPLADA